MSDHTHTVIEDLMGLLTEEDRARIASLKAELQAQEAVFSRIDARRDLVGRRAADFEKEAERLEGEKRSETDLVHVDAFLNADLSAALDYSGEDLARLRAHNEDVQVRQSRAKNIAKALRDEEEECAAQAKLDKSRLRNTERDYYLALANITADLHDRSLWAIIAPLLSFFGSLQGALRGKLEGGAGRLDIVINQHQINFWENNSFTRVWPPTGNGHDRFLQRKGVSLTEPAEALDAMVEALSGANPRA